MAIYSGDTLTGTTGDDFLIGTPNSGAGETMFGGQGNDVLFGDHSHFWFAGGVDQANAVNIMDPTYWTTGTEDADIHNRNGVPHTSTIVELDGSSQEVWYAVSMDADDELTVDIDFGNHVVGGSVDTRVEVRLADGTIVEDNRDSSLVNPADYGSTSRDDSYLTYTADSSATYYIRITTSTGAALPDGTTFIANFSHTGATASGSGPAGADYMEGGSGQDVMFGGGNGDEMYGGGDVDRMFGGKGGDTMRGGNGEDSLNGGNGNDLFEINGTTDADLDNINGDGGKDTADFSLLSGPVTIDLGSRSYTYGAESYRIISIETVNGTDGDDVMEAGSSKAAFNGGAGSDSLTGGRSADRLDGGTDADVMAGGLANDRYYVDNAGDSVVEAASQGFDRVFTTVDYTLEAGSSVEFMSSQGTGLALYGNELKNKILGDSGANQIWDGDGAGDRLMGRGGDDIYYVWAEGTRAVEGSNTGGTDTVYVDDNDYNIRNIDRIEVLSVYDTSSLVDVNLEGNKRANTIIGNDGNNVLIGGKGQDVLTGNGEADAFVFDVAPNNGNADTITDFTVGEDFIVLDRDVFTRIGTSGVLDSSRLVVNTTGEAENASDRFIYDSSTGELYYDRDGSGGTRSPKLIADIGAGLTTIDETSFLVFSSSADGTDDLLTA